MSSKELIELLEQSSSLRVDLLDHAIHCVKDILNNIDLSDELCARVDNDTFEFIKEWKE